MPDERNDPRTNWIDDAGPRWARHADVLDRMLAPFSDALLEAARPEPGRRLIDVGCGAGELALRIAERVRPDGAVLGIDVSEALLEVAAHRHRERPGLPFSSALADAQTHPFGEGSFDGAVSRFGWMFFEDTGAALANLRRAIRPGGRLDLACWGPRADNPWVAVPWAALGEVVDLPEVEDVDEPGPFRMGNRERLDAAFAAGGLTDVEVRPMEGVLHLADSDDVDEALHFATEIGAASRIHREADAATRAAIERALREVFEREGTRLGYVAWIVSARVPG